MDSDNLTHRHCGESEGVVVPEVEFVGEGQLGDVVNTLDVAWFESHLLELLPVEGGVVIDILSHLHQTTALDLTKLFAIHALNAFVPNHVVFYLVC